MADFVVMTPAELAKHPELQIALQKYPEAIYGKATCIVCGFDWITMIERHVPGTHLECPNCRSGCSIFEEQTRPEPEIDFQI